MEDKLATTVVAPSRWYSNLLSGFLKLFKPINTPLDKVGTFLFGTCLGEFHRPSIGATTATTDNDSTLSALEPIRCCKDDTQLELGAIAIRLGAPYVIFEHTLYPGRTSIPTNISALALMPLETRLLTIKHQLDRLTASDINSPEDRFLCQIYSACANLSSELTLDQGIDDSLLPLIQLLPELRSLKLGNHTPCRLRALSYIPLEARMSLLEEFGTQNMADMPAEEKEYFSKILQACENHATSLSISTCALKKLARLTQLLPELKILKIGNSSVHRSNLGGLLDLGPLETLIIDGSRLEGFYNFSPLWCEAGNTLIKLIIHSANNLESLTFGDMLIKLRELSLSGVPKFQSLATGNIPMRKLRKLSIYLARKLTTLGNMENFPALEVLHIGSVKKLDCLQGLENLPALRKIVISCEDRERLLPKLIKLSLPPGVEVFESIPPGEWSTKIGHFAPLKGSSEVNSRPHATIFIATSVVVNSCANLGNSLVSMPESSETLASPIGRPASIDSFPELPLSGAYLVFKGND